MAMRISPFRNFRAGAVSLPDHHPYYYKYLNGYHAIYGVGSWPDRKWLKVAGELKPCDCGLHVLTPDGLVDWIGKDLYRVQVRGDYTWKDEGKVLVVREARIHSKVEQWNERNVRYLAADFAQWAVDRYWPDPEDLRPQQAIDAALRHADDPGYDTSAAVSAARSAARSAAESAAESAAVSAAVSAAKSAAWSAARSAAESAAWYAAHYAAWSSAAELDSAARPAVSFTAWPAVSSTAWPELNELLIKRMSL